MKNRILAFTCLCVLMLNLVGTTAAADGGKKSRASQSAQLVQMLPASDGVVTIDVKRFFSVALPKVLSANQPMLQMVTSHIDEMKAKTGIDIRQFDHIAAGVTARQISGKDYDVDPVVIARGRISSGGLLGAAKLAANDKYREEKAGDKSIFIFDSKDLAEQARQQVPAAKNSGAADKVISKLSKEIAVTAIDANTIAFGDPELVRQTVGTRTPVSGDLVSLLSKRETSVVSFAAKMPNGMGALIPLDNDELGKNIDAIRYIYGGMDFVGEALAVNMTARTLQDTQAKALLETLEGLQIIGKAFLGGSKGADKQVYARMIDNAKFSSRSNEVIFDLTVAQADIDVLIGMMK